MTYHQIISQVHATPNRMMLVNRPGLFRRGGFLVLAWALVEVLTGALA